MSTENKNNEQNNYILDRFGDDNTSKNETDSKDDKIISSKDEKKLDNKENNSYINYDSDKKTNTSNNEVTEQVDKYQKLLNETFGGDATKLAKSYLASQSEYQKLRNQAKESEKYKQAVANLDAIIDRNPKLAELLMKAAGGEDIESYLNSGLELKGKPNNQLFNSKLDANTFKVDEKTLIEEGFLDGSNRENLTAIEWNTMRLEAQAEHLQQVAPERMFQSYQQKVQEYETQRQKEQEKNTIITVNKQRFNKSFEDAIAIGFDFAGEHKDILDEVEQLAKSILDPENPRLLHKDAVLLASKYVADNKGIKVGKRELPITNNNIQPQRNMNSYVPHEQSMSVMEKVYKQQEERFDNLNTYRGSLNKR